MASDESKSITVNVPKVDLRETAEMLGILAVLAVLSIFCIAGVALALRLAMWAIFECGIGGRCGA